MTHLTQSELRVLLESIRKLSASDKQVSPASLAKEEQEALKMYIPMQLGEESAKKMMTMMNAVREGKRTPLTEEERVALNEKNMAESLVNFLAKLATASNDEFEAMCEMCECIRASRSDR